MSKAFTKETEEEAELPDALNTLPRGAKNYITPDGMARLQAELLHYALLNGCKSSRRSLGLQATATDQKMVTISMARNGYARLIGACAF
jgi:hypothetical protein